MPVRKQDAHRALELLQDYRSHLGSPDDQQLISAIDRVIHVFQSRLFQALIDIREFYETTLLDESKSTEEKTQEAMGIASRWELQSGIPVINDAKINNNYSSLLRTSSQGLDNRYQHDPRSSQPQSYSSSTRLSMSLDRSTAGTVNNLPSSSSMDYKMTNVNGCNRGDMFHHPPVHGEIIEEVHLERGPNGFGFSIAGGAGTVDNDEAVYITRITAGGIVDIDGRLRLNDTLISVNTESVVGATHQEVVDKLRKSGNRLSLVVRRQPDTPVSSSASQPSKSLKQPAAEQSGLTNSHSQYATTKKQISASQPGLNLSSDPSKSGPPVHMSGGPPERIMTQPASTTMPRSTRDLRYMAGSVSGSSTSVASAPPETGAKEGELMREEVLMTELVKGNLGLGFSIAGGRGNEHILNDPGIFITKLIEGTPAQLDGRIEVGDRLIQVNNTLLADVTHEEAVEILKDTGQRVTLTFIKPPKGRPFRYTEEDSGHQLMNEKGGGLRGTKTPFSSGIIHNSVIDDDLPQRLNYHTYDSISREPRLIVLYRGPTGLGFNIVGGEGDEGIFVSHLMPKGPAQLSALLYKGDKLLKVNQCVLTNATHEEAAQALKNAGNRVEIVAQYCPEEYAQYEMACSEASNSPPIMPSYNSNHIIFNNNNSAPSSTVDGLAQDSRYINNQPPLQQQQVSTATLGRSSSSKKSLFVRALFDYDPSKDSGLPNTGLAFRFGDILHVTNPHDDEWWQARRVSLSSREESRPGVIPSKKRVERKERARLKRVNFERGVSNNNSVDTSNYGSLEKRKRGGSLLRKFQLSGSKSTREIEQIVSLEEKLEEILAYELVVQEVVDYSRPVIIMGPLKDRINDDLISEFSDKFGSCIPHTTRPKRDYEEDGRDYHFVTREAMERDIRNQQFIEAGQYQGNLYGTSAASVWEVARNNLHCIVDVSGNAMRRLRAVGLQPIAILVRPISPDHIKALNPRMNEEQTLKAYEKFSKIEADFAKYFTAIITDDTYQAIYSRVKDVIREHSGTVIWTPIEPNS